MKQNIFFLFVLLISQLSGGQTGKENQDLVFDSADLKIIQKADSILSDPSKWSKQDDRNCEDDIANGKYSLYCSLYKASVDIAGDYVHRRAAMQIVRFTLEKYENGRVVNHRLMDWNNHPDTTFEEVKKVLKESMDAVKSQLDQTQIDLATLRETLQKLDDQFAESFKKGDSVAIAEHYSTDGTWGGTKGRDNLVSAWGKFIRYAHATISSEIKYTITSLFSDNDFIIEIGTYEFIGEDNNVINSGKYLVVRKLENGHWKMYRDIGL